MSAVEVRRRLDQMTSAERQRIDAYIRHDFCAAHAAKELRCDRETVKATFNRYVDCIRFLVTDTLDNTGHYKA